MSEKFTHLDQKNNPSMVDVADKAVTDRTAVARSIVRLNDQIMGLLEDGDIKTKKGAVFQTAIIAGIMGAKKTSDLIPLCHPLQLAKVAVDIAIIEDNKVEIICTAKLKGQTGVEMEALTGASVAALTIYDMCKAFSHDIRIEETVLLKKKGGKSDFERT